MTPALQLKSNLDIIAPFSGDTIDNLSTSTQNIVLSCNIIARKKAKVERLHNQSAFVDKCKHLVSEVFPNSNKYSKKKIERYQRVIDHNVRKALKIDMRAGKYDLLNKVKNEILTLKRGAISANKLLTDSVESIIKAADQVEAYIETRLTSYGTAFTPEIKKEIKLLSKLKKAHKQITSIVKNFYANHLFVEFSPSEVKHICLTRLALSSSHDQLRVGRERARVIKESNQALMSEKTLPDKADLGTRVRFSPTTVTHLVTNTHYPQAKAQPK